jgi:hypothetical protein
MASSPGLLALDHARLEQFLQLLLHPAYGLASQFGQASWCDGRALALQHENQDEQPNLLQVCRGRSRPGTLTIRSTTMPGSCGASPSWHHTCLPWPRSRAKPEQSYGVVAATPIIFGSDQAARPARQCYRIEPTCHGERQFMKRYAGAPETETWPRPTRASISATACYGYRRQPLSREHVAGWPTLGFERH